LWVALLQVALFQQSKPTLSSLARKRGGAGDNLSPQNKKGGSSISTVTSTARLAQGRPPKRASN
jgi:hypothetical protein